VPIEELDALQEHW
jgi:hypothetical protein